MNERHEIDFGGRQIGFSLRRSRRRTLAITVHSELKVVVTAPENAAMETVLAMVRKRAGWIRKQERFFGEFLPQTPPRIYASGETHRYLGRQYRLKVIEPATADVKMRGRFIWVQTPRKGDTAQVRKLVEELVSGAREGTTGAKLCGEHGSDGNTIVEPTTNASPADEQALGQLDPAQRSPAES